MTGMGNKSKIVLLFGNLRSSDPRYGQLVVLSALLVYGISQLDFAFLPAFPAVVILTVLIVQYGLSRCLRQTVFEWRSALITGLSLVLLLRSDSLFWGVAAAIIAITGKFLLRWRGKAVFNPSNLALTSTLLLTPHCWLSPGQWGASVILSAFGLSVAWMILNRVERLDIAVAFLLFYSVGLFGRAVWLGDPMTIPMHQLLQGSLLIFALFMITDPKTTPDHRLARFGFALMVATLALVGRFVYYQPNALIYALTLCSPLTPLFDRCFPFKNFQWIDHSPL